MIKKYLKEFHENPNDIEEYKISALKDHYYKYVNSILKIEKNNFQIGVTKNFKLLFFRDKKFQQTELVLNLIEEKTFFNYRRQISYSVSSINLDKINSKNSLETNKLLNLSITRLNTHAYLNQNCFKFKCIVS